MGERGDTAKNEALRLPDGSYRPAYELAEEEEHLERSPRTPTHSPRHPTSDGGGGCSSSREENCGEKSKRFSSWDKEWESVGVQGVAAAVGAGGAGGVISTSSTSATSSGSGSGARVDACAKSKALELGSTAKACRQTDGKFRGSGWRGLVGLAGWLPVTTVALALVLAAVGLRSSSGSSRGGEQDSAPDKGD